MKIAFYTSIILVMMLLIIPIKVLSKEKKIDELTWLTGSWMSNSEKELVEELWITPKNGIMLGLNRASSQSGKVFLNIYELLKEITNWFISQVLEEVRKQNLFLQQPKVKK